MCIVRIVTLSLILSSDIPNRVSTINLTELLFYSTSDDVAFCHFLYHITGTLTNRSEVDMWVRDTVCYRKLEGKWLVTHEHTSVPFDGESGKASLALKP